MRIKHTEVIKSNCFFKRILRTWDNWWNFFKISTSSSKQMNAKSLKKFFFCQLHFLTLKMIFCLRDHQPAPSIATRPSSGDFCAWFCFAQWVSDSVRCSRCVSRSCSLPLPYCSLVVCGTFSNRWRHAWRLGGILIDDLKCLLEENFVFFLELKWLK